MYAPRIRARFRVTPPILPHVRVVLEEQETQGPPLLPTGSLVRTDYCPRGGCIVDVQSTCLALKFSILHRVGRISSDRKRTLDTADVVFWAPNVLHVYFHSFVIDRDSQTDPKIMYAKSEYAVERNDIGNSRLGFPMRGYILALHHNVRSHPRLLFTIEIHTSVPKDLQRAGVVSKVVRIESAAES